MYITGLGRGLAGRLLRLYALEQRYLQVKRGGKPEPAYLLLSSHTGGFPRFGFFLAGEDKRAAGYVDLKFTRRIGGGFGTMDQIFPHELGHVLLAQLAGPPKPGGSNQMHAVGVRTDPANAFSEGFAEHFQVMAADDPDALPETRALLRDDYFERRTERQMREYREELAAAWPGIARRRVAFPVWFSGAEQVLRYYAVKANAFARQPAIDARLLRADPYAAYLLENTLPGLPGDPPKNAVQMASTEGVVAALFVRWVTDPRIQQRRREDAFYAPFGVASGDVGPLENAYLKLFHAFSVSRPSDVCEAIDGYKAAFPDEASIVDDVVRTISLGRSFARPPAIWLANDAFHVGTSLFDQFRTMPRVHTFDLNAASLVDLVAIPGVSRSTADAIRQHAPYRSLEELGRVSVVDGMLYQRFRALYDRSLAMRSNPGDEESGLSLGAILRPYVIRAIILILVAGLLGAAAYRVAVPRGWARAILDGLGAAILAFFLEIALEFPVGVLGAIAPPVVFGLPAAVWCLVFPARTARALATRGSDNHHPGRLRSALAVLFAWALAPLPLVLLMTPHF